MSSRDAVLRVAIVGAGPAGAYAAERLLKADGVEVEVELFDRLPTPWGLVRAGVAPDHPKIKSVTRVFEKTADHPALRFHGGVDVGETITHDELAEHHHAVVYAQGASADRRLGISGEDLPGNVPATEFVAWYNGHPDAADLAPPLDCKRAVIVGNGNVALDVARMLVLGQDELRCTDTADHAIEAFAGSRVEEVVVLGRRGAAQASWTLPELKELRDLEGVDVVIEDPGPAAEDVSGPAARAAALIEGYTAGELTGAPRRIVLRFCTSPLEMLGGERVTGLRVGRNRLVERDGRWSPEPTGEEEVLECGLVVRSIGYRGTEVAGLPFDGRNGTLPNEAGRIVGEDGAPLPGAYTAGWIKRGPSGVIGTNKKCANETVDTLLTDLEAGRVPARARTGEELDELLERRGVHRVDVEGWRRIDQHERDLGEAQGRPRVKLVAHADLRERAGVAS